MMRTNPRIVFIGYDSRQMAPYQVARKTVEANLPGVMVRPLILEDLVEEGLYTRPTEMRNGNQLYDVISEASMSTEFANSRFLTPHLALNRFPILTKRKGKFAKKQGWALFMDCDMVVRSDLNPIFNWAERVHSSKALICVQHVHRPEDAIKMDGQVQQKYNRKNWSSVMLFNLDHPANQRLTLDMINELPGRDLHRFCWLEDDEIGALPLKYNFLINISDPALLEGEEPVILHFTEGGPWLPNYRDVPYADEWMEAMLF